MVALGKGRLQDWAEDFIVQHNLPVTLLEYATDVGQYLEQARVAFVSGYLTIAESMALGKPIVAVYETPIKHDYLTCHPQAGAMGIVQSPAEIAQTAEAALALKRDDPKLRAAQAWALEQTWPHIADRYARQYEIASR